MSKTNLLWRISLILLSLLILVGAFDVASEDEEIIGFEPLVNTNEDVQNFAYLKRLPKKPEPIEEPVVLPIAQYKQVDGFAAAQNLKGTQGMSGPEYGGAHSLLNLWIDSYIADYPPDDFDVVYPYKYGEQTYYINISGLELFIGNIKKLNDQNITVSLVFLLKYTEGREFLIDEAARVPGKQYYAPATEGASGDGVKAFFEFFMWRVSAWNAAVDNFIIGNEVNNPNRWHYSGTLSSKEVAKKYAALFYNVYSIVRGYSQISRVSISLDHNWAYNDRGREIAGQQFLLDFSEEIDSYSKNIVWCISYHLYPAIVTNTAIWRKNGYNQNSPNAMFIDGANLNVLSDFVLENFGEEHRIMLTEQGFYHGSGEKNQAVALAISYYAAKYNPLVDNFILYQGYDEDSSLYFSIAGNLAEDVFTKIDNGNEEDKRYIEQLILEVSKRTVAEMVAGYE